MNLSLLQVGQTNIAHPATGAQLRNYHLARQLGKAMRVNHLGFDDGHRNPVNLQNDANIPVTLIPKPEPYSIAKLLKGAFGRIPAGILNFESETMTGALKATLAAHHYDIVQMEGVELFGHLRTVLLAPRRPRLIVWDWHNIESELMHRYSLRAATPFHKIYLRRTAEQMKVLEHEILANCDLHLVMSKRERDHLMRLRPDAHIAVVENGVDSHHFDAQLADCRDPMSWSTRNRVLFVGTMDYHPNADAVQYFCDEVWPRIHRQMPFALFTIVGRNPPAKVLDLGRRPGVEVTGTVVDVRPYYQKAFAVVVPLRMGGGTRLKILEAMAAGVPVVSTTLGTEGLSARPDNHLKIADTPGDFQSRIGNLRNDRGLWQRLSNAGRTLVEERYDWSVIGTQLTGIYRRLFENDEVASAQRSGALI